MKTFIFSLIAAAALCMPVQAKERTVTERDSLGNTKRIIELLDTVRDGQAVTDTLSITTYDNPTRHRYSVSYDADDFFHIGKEDVEKWADSATTSAMLVALGLFLFFITPVVLIILIFYFRNKNRRQRYLLMQQALASGQQLPKEVFKDVAPLDYRTKGIKNMALGIGLFFFLWMLTSQLSIGCIGLLIFCIGAGQLAIHYTTPKRDNPYARPTDKQSHNEKPATDNSTAANDPTGQA